jgi:hemolysin III
MAKKKQNQAIPTHLPLSQVSGQVEPEIKPTWRGWIHTGVLPITIAAGIVLVVLADGIPAKIASAVFFASSVLLFGTSALYHRFNWGPKAKITLKRIDHSNIFLLIAGSYTPISWLALPQDKALILMIAIWSTALLGIGFRVFWIGAPRWLYVIIYLAMGWAAVVFMVDLYTANNVMMILIIVGGLFYSLGAVVYAMKRPNPFPGHFGFHEIFHTATVLAFLCHWVAVLIIAMNPIPGSFA